MSPPYPAYLEPLHFPTAEAEAAITVCDRIVGLLNDQLTTRATIVSAVREDWQGTHREEFDDTWSVQETRLVSMKESLQTLSGNLTDAMSDVSTANANRSEGRAEWIQNNPGPYPV